MEEENTKLEKMRIGEFKNAREEEEEEEDAKCSR